MSYAKRLGQLPDEFRPTLIRPLEDREVMAHPSYPTRVRGIRRTYFNNPQFEQADPVLGENYTNLFRKVAELGEISCEAGFGISLTLMQGPAQELGNVEDWHTDTLRVQRKRVIVANVYGPLYETETGEHAKTPDFELLGFDGDARHSPQPPELGLETTFKSRLMVSSMPSLILQSMSD